MQGTDAYTSRRLLYQSDILLSQIYTNSMKLTMLQDKEQTQKTIMKEIDKLIFHIFKQKTALTSLQKDIITNQQKHFEAQAHIEISKKQISSLSESLKKAQNVRKRKIQYNKIARELKNYQNWDELDIKIKNTQRQVQKLNNEYRKQIQLHEQKQICLKVALSALRGLCTHH